MDDKLAKACNGKSASQGGMNVPELYQLARRQGYTGPKLRMNILDYVCSKETKTNPNPNPIHTSTSTSTSTDSSTSTSTDSSSVASGTVKYMNDNPAKIREFIATHVEPRYHLPIDIRLKFVFHKYTSNKTKLKKFFSKLPLTNSIKYALDYSLDHNGHLKVSSLVNKIGKKYLIHETDNDFVTMGLPPLNRLIYHELLAIISLTDECELGGTVKLMGNPYLLHGRPDSSPKFDDVDEASILDPSGQIHFGSYGKLARIIKARMNDVRKQDKCKVVMFKLEVPGHAMVMAIRDFHLYVFDTHDPTASTTWDDYWNSHMNPDVTQDKKAHKVISRFFLALLETNAVKKIFINNRYEIKDTPFPIYPIPSDDMCPNFQAQSGVFRHKMSHIRHKLGLTMFPGGFCLPWAYLVVATYMTYGEIAPYLLQDFMINPDYYQGYDPSDIPQLHLLIIHLLSVYLTEITTLLV